MYSSQPISRPGFFSPTSLISTTTMLSALPAIPPSAHTTTRKASSSAIPPTTIVTQQPPATRSMSLTSADEHKQKNTKVNRLRGGCIPCPDGGCCFIIPLPCCC
ncbi:hypothetical protein F5880DRAFT_1091731 [Lentinula raphanica]|nr:hypothetical protein F5880DRAFT_1091731 [Lentinula raphanica]